MGRLASAAGVIVVVLCAAPATGQSNIGGAVPDVIASLKWILARVVGR